jgi:hypothetical protein
MSISLLVFANSKASDYIPITLDRLKQFFPKIKSYLGIDSYDNSIKQYYEFDDIIIYDINDTWSKKMYDILLKIKEEYIFLLIDNNIFVDHFTEDMLKSYIDIMQKYDIDQLRMIPSGIIKPTISQKNEDNIYKICDTDYSISLQPAIWKNKTFYDIITKSIHIDYRDFEVYANKLNIKSNNYFIYTEKDFIKNEVNFSYGCPFFHALTYGKWVNASNLYIKLLDDIQNEYHIDLNKRGFF